MYKKKETEDENGNQFGNRLLHIFLFSPSLTPKRKEEKKKRSYSKKQSHVTRSTLDSSQIILL